MASKNLFKGTGTGGGKGKIAPTDTTNNAGGKAYSMTAKHELAQLVATGMLGDTFYVSAEDQLRRVLELAAQLEPLFLAQLAVYARESGKMKDMPALLCAVMFAQGDDAYLKLVFPRVIDNGRMLRNFVQIVRSGQTGRKSLGTLGKKLVQAYFDSRTPEQLFKDTVGNDPSLADVIKLAHVRPTDATRQALYRYIVGQELNAEQKAVLPELVQDFEAFKFARNTPNSAHNPAVPDVPFQMLTALKLTTSDWSTLADNGGWQFCRMNLNTFARHGVFTDKKITKAIAQKLADPKEVARSRVLPYQLLTAYINVDSAVPSEVKNALQDALEHATKNVQPFGVNGVEVMVDTSGSMRSPVSGNRGSATTAASCIDVAALVAATVLRRNPDTVVVPFDTRVHSTGTINDRDSIVTNADKLRKFGGGGTDCASALADANKRKSKAQLVIYVSDNESWYRGDGSAFRNYYGTDLAAEWKKYKARNPNAKLVCIDLTPNGTTQATNDKDVLNIGGFSDSIFEVINAFVSSKNGEQWVEVIEKTVI